MALQKLLKQNLEKAFLSTDKNAVDLSKISPLQLAKGVGVALLALLFGCAAGPFGCHPFGIALLSAANVFVPHCLLGLVISSLFLRGQAVAMTVAYILCFSARALICRKLLARPDARLARSVHGMFGESILIRCAISCFCAFVIGMLRLITGGFLYYDLFGLTAGFFLCPLCTLALSGMFTKNEQIRRYAELSAGTLIFITVFALREYSVWGFSPAFAAAFFVTLWAASCGGALRGCAVGLAAGIACGSVRVFEAAENADLAYSVGAAPCLLATAGLLAGFLWKRNKPAAMAAGCVALMTVGVAMDGFEILQRLLPDTLTAAAVFAPLSLYNIMPRLPVFSSTEADRRDEEFYMMEKKHTDTTLRMHALSETFSHLSEVIYTLSDRLRRPGIMDLKQVCDRVFDGCCEKCSLFAFCWERESSSTMDAQSKITAALYQNGRIELSDIPPYLRERCYNIEKITANINLETAHLIERLIGSDKTEAFAVDYDALSKLLAESVAKNDAEYKINEELTKKLQRSLRYMDLRAAGALCYGERKKQVIIGGVELASVRMGAEELRLAVENTLQTPLCMPHFHIEEDTVTVTLRARRCFRIESARASNVKEEESTNGDTAAVFENREDFCYALISDGMGSGKEAAITSKLCAVFCEQMLRSGNTKHVTLEMLNGFIRSRGNECSATIDLAEIDLLSGEAFFVKSGAAPSYVLREGNLYKLQSKTVPIGILRDLDAEQIRLDLEAGDILVMFSDGVAQSLEEGIWLAELLGCEWEDDLQRMADKILEHAVMNNTRSDDMTVVLMRITENGAEEGFSEQEPDESAIK